MAATKREWTTPVGTLSVGDDGSIRAVIRVNPRSERAIVSGVQTVAGLKQTPFLKASGFQQDPDGLVLSWPAMGMRFTELPALVPGWRKNPAVHLPDAFDLVQNVLRASSELDHERPRQFFLSPAQVFSCEHEVQAKHWGVVPLPAEGATCADFAGAAPELLAWVSADEVLGGGSMVDRAYLAGAVLYYSLIGELFPEKLNRNDRIRRLLTYHAGNAARAKSVLSAALPKRLAGLGTRLSDFILSLLSPSLGRMITPARAGLEINLLQAELSPPLLAAAWEAEGNSNFAAEILNAFAQRATENEVPWETLARLRAQTGDPAGSAAAALKVPRSPQQEQATFIGHLRALASRGAEGRAEIEKEVARLKSAGPKKTLPQSEPFREGGVSRGQQQQRVPDSPDPPLSDQEFLYLVYVNGRWLARTDESLNFLERDFSVSWHRIVQAILVARFSADRNVWGGVLRSCRDCRRMIEKLPDGGSAAGRYARAYVDTMDAIGHVRAVEGGMSDAYLEDALMKFQSAWSQLQEFEPDELDPVIRTWLASLSRNTAAKPGLELLKLSAEAFCQSLAIQPARFDRDSALPVPWFSEERIFAA